MARYITLRLIQIPITLLAIATIVFVLERLAGDPTQLILPIWATADDVARLKHSLGLDQPLIVQYLYFVRDLAGGNFGTSVVKDAPAMGIILQRFPATAELAFLSLIVGSVIGIAAGAVSAFSRDSLVDSFLRAFTIMGQAIPVFVIGISLLIVFSVWFQLLPFGGQRTAVSLILPAVTLAWYTAAGVARLTRSSMLDVLGNDYIRTARAKGLPERTVVWRHAFRNSLLTVVTYTGTIFVRLLGGTVLVEAVFAWPGVGLAMLDAIQARDYPVIQAGVFLLAAINVFGNLIVDVSYTFLNPRIRYA